MQLKGYCDKTIKSYVRIIAQIALHYQAVMPTVVTSAVTCAFSTTAAVTGTVHNARG
jgi:hypothetical protein